MGVEISHYYCFGKSVEIIELKVEVGGSGGYWGDVDINDIELLFV